MMKILLLVFLISILSSCSHSVHLVNVGDHEPFAKYNQGTPIHSTSEQFAFLGFVFDTDYVDIARLNLIDQCANGQIQGITTKYYTSHGFFYWKNKIEMWGLCVLKS